jgi:hypothetical protein
MSTYFAHISAAGPIRYGQVPGSIGVLEALDKFMPIGVDAADRQGRDSGPMGDRRSGVSTCAVKRRSIDARRTLRYWSN